MSDPDSIIQLTRQGTSDLGVSRPSKSIRGPDKRSYLDRTVIRCYDLGIRKYYHQYKSRQGEYLPLGNDQGLTHCSVGFGLPPGRGDIVWRRRLQL